MNGSTDETLSRIVDRSETPDDWQMIEGQEDESLYYELAMMLRDDCNLRQAIRSRVDRAERVALPVLSAETSAAASQRSWLLGAAAVFVLALGWFFGRTPAPATPTEPAKILADYLEVGHRNGQVLDQLPNVTLEVRPAGDGQSVEVIYVRRLVERVVVDEAWRLGTDEHGQPQPAKVDLASYKTASSL